MRNFFIYILLVFTINVFSLPNDEEIFDNAEKNFDRENFKIALDYYNDLTRNYPLTKYYADAQFKRGLTLFKLDRYEEALKVFLRVKERYQTNRYNEYLPFWLGLSLYYSKDYKEAKKSFFEYIVNKPKKFIKEAFLYKALSEYKIGEYDLAYEDAMLLNDTEISAEEEPAALALIMAILIKKERYDDVLKLNKIFDDKNVNPKYINEINLYRAEAFYKLKQNDKAEFLYKALLSSKNGLIASTSVQRLFDIYREKKDYVALNELIKSGPIIFSDNEKALDTLNIKYGVEKFKLERYDEAIDSLLKVWNKYSDLNKIDITVPTYLSEAFYKSSKLDRAVSVLKNYSDGVKEQDEYVLLRAAYIFADLKEWKECREFSERFIYNFPESKDFSTIIYLYLYCDINEGKGYQVLDKLEQLENEFPQIIGDKNLEKLKNFLKDIGKGEKDFKNIDIDYKLSLSRDRAFWMNLIKQSYKAKNYQKILDDVENLFKKNPRLKFDDLELFYFASYMQGLSFINFKDYNGAKKSLQNIDLKKIGETNLSALTPYITYYEGWCYYRLVDYNNSLKKFYYYMENYRDGEFFLNSILYAAWSEYSLNNFRNSSKNFDRYSKLVNGDDKYSAMLLAAKSYGQAGDEKRALEIYFDLIDTGSEKYASKALYEYYTFLRKANKVSDAIDILTKLVQKYPKSEFVKESYFILGELNYKIEKFSQSEKFYSSYYEFFQDGENLESAIFFAGMAAYKNLDYKKAIVHWNKFILKFPQSPFMEEVLEKIADSYIKMEDYKKAEEYYNIIKIKYPKKAKSINVDKIISKISYLFSGKSEREADLSLVIKDNGGISTQKGRAAILLLADYNFDKNDADKKRESYFYLQEIISKYSNSDKGATGYSHFLLGKFFKQKQEYNSALESYLKSLLFIAGDYDYAEESLYNIAELSIKLKNSADLKNALETLNKNYPDSEWTKKANSLKEKI